MGMENMGGLVDGKDQVSIDENFQRGWVRGLWWFALVGTGLRCRGKLWVVQEPVKGHTAMPQCIRCELLVAGAADPWVRTEGSGQRLRA